MLRSGNRRLRDKGQTKTAGNSQQLCSTTAVAVAVAGSIIIIIRTLETWTPAARVPKLESSVASVKSSFRQREKFQ
jgi:hypothetical protein